MNPKNSLDLFNKIRSQFSNIRLGDENGAATASPQNAVFFEFEFREDADTFGAVSISLADGENMKVYYNRDLVNKIDEDSKDEWYAFLKELKDFAVEHSLRFDVRDITKNNLTKQDYENLADTSKTVNTDEMSEELNRITKLAGVEEAPIDRGAPADKGRPAEPEAGLTGGVAPTTIAKQFPGVDDKSSLVRAVTKMKQGQSNYSRDEITAAADAFKEILGKDPKETSRLMTLLKGVAQKANPFNHPDDWVGHGMMKNKDANVKGKGRGTPDSRKGTVWGTESVSELEKITKLAGVDKAPVAEGLTGTSKSSFENLDKTKLIIRHKGKVDETVPGARSRQIQSLYIENEDGERFKYPLTHLAGARAMQRHVANGGRPHDEFGEHIVSTSEDIAKLNSFSRYASNKDQLNDNAGDIIEQTKLKLENLRGYMRNLSKQSHYENASKDFKTSEEQILDDETVNKLREKFTMKNLDSRVEDAFPIINKIMSEFEANKEAEQVNELEPDAEPIDAPVQAPVDHGAVVQSFLNDPEQKLVLRKDDSADKMLKTTKFTNKNTMLSSILSDIASRLLTKSGEEDRVANFASRVADEMEQENSATFKPTPDYIKNKKIAIQLAKRYIDDYKKMQAEPEYTDQVRMEPGAFAPKKDIKGKDKETEAFENWVNDIDEYATPEPKDPEIEKKDKENATKLDVTKADKMLNNPAYQRMKAGDPRYADKTENQLEGLTFEDIKPYVSMYRDDQTGKMTYDVLDKDGASAFKTSDSKVAMAYLSKNFKKLRMDKDERIDQAMAAQKKDAETNPNWGKDKGPVDPEADAEKDHREISRIMKYEDQKEAEVINTELDRIKTLANLS